LLGQQRAKVANQKNPFIPPNNAQVVPEILNSSAAPETIHVSDPTPEKATFEMRESRVPSTRIGRLWQYGGLGMSMAFGAVGESLRRATGGGTDGSIFLSPGNLELLVAKLSRMRGAALKLGQMVSFQGMSSFNSTV